ncbi:MAG: single-stranded DNA-binding protein [Bacteroidia bacterium]
MSGINKVILVGNLGKDPEVRHLEGGVTVAKFTLATSDGYKKPDGTRVDTTEWHNIVMWRQLAETAEKYLRKGSLIYLEGKIRTRSWEDNGVKKYFTEITADTWTFLGRRPEDASSNTATGEEIKSNIEIPAVPASGPEPGDDLPF